MLALLLCLGLFGFWWIVGYAVIRSLHATRSGVQDVLLASPVGIVCLLIPVWTINRLGIPVGKFGWAVALVELIAALAILWRLRGKREGAPGFHWNKLLPFVGVLVVALIATAHPMLKFGFDWVSYCNDDMANYCLAADRFYHYGFFDFPQPDHLIKGEYWADVFWFMHVWIGQRPGCELLLSWTMSVTRLNAHEVFMPVIMAMFLGLVTTASALVMFPSELARRRADKERIEPAESDVDGNYTAAWMTGLLVALSALTTLGVMYQLIAQVVGLSLIATVSALVLRPFDGLSRNQLLKHGVLCGVMGAGVLIIYPEILPFLGLPFLMYFGVALLKRRVKFIPVAGIVAVSLVVTFVLLRFYSIQSVLFLRKQAGAVGGDGATGAIARTLFPYFLVPKGFADLWGFQRIGYWTVWPGWLDLSILGGAILFIFAFYWTAKLTFRNRPEATVAFVMIGLGLVLFKNRSGFGLFKLAMYLQPFVLGAIVIAWFAISRKIIFRRTPKDVAPSWRRSIGLRVLQIVPLLGLSSAGLWSQSAYMASSYGLGTAFLEIPDASRTKLNDEFKNVLVRYPSEQVVSDTFNMVLAKFQALYTSGRELVFPANRYTLNIEAIDDDMLAEAKVGPQFMEKVLAYRTARNASMPVELFDLKNPANPKQVNHFRVTDKQLDPVLSHADRETGAPVTPSKVGPDGKEPVLVVSVGRQSVFNRFQFPPQPRKGNVVLPPRDENFVSMPMSKARDILVYIASDLAPPYFFTGTTARPAIYQMEVEPKDSPFFRGATMCGAGQYMLCQVVNPSPKIRLAVSMTVSYHGDHKNELPMKFSAIGSQRVPFPVVGRGSARVFSAPFTPQWIRGRPYVMYDMGWEGEQFPSNRVGLMRLFGTDVPLDRRILSSFVRDISLVSEEEYAALLPPREIAGFLPYTSNPLRDPQLEYSGMYEDGWVAEDAYVRLFQPDGAMDIIVRGTVPLVGGNKDYTNHAILSVDGEVVAEADVKPGDFMLRAKSPATTGSVHLAEQVSTTTQPTTTSPSQTSTSHLPVPPDAARPADAPPGQVRTVRLQFTGPLQHLEHPDNRPAAAVMRYIGFQASAPSVAQGK